MNALLLVLSESPRLRYTETVLLRAGYQVLAAATVEDAIRVCNHGAEPVHLVIMDSAAEQSHGGRLLGMYPSVPALVLADTGSGDVLDRVRQALARSPVENA